MDVRPTDLSTPGRSVVASADMSLPGVGAVRRVLPTLALLVSLVGCQASTPAPEPTYVLAADVIHSRCGASTFIIGLIVVDSGKLAIQDDDGVITPLLWSVHGGVVPKVGHRYRIEGQIAEWYGDALWACAGAEHVIPQ